MLKYLPPIFSIENPFQPANGLLWRCQCQRLPAFLNSRLSKRRVAGHNKTNFSVRTIENINFFLVGLGRPSTYFAVRAEQHAFSANHADANSHRLKDNSRPNVGYWEQSGRKPV
jgi:hypothetical protein